MSKKEKVLLVLFAFLLTFFIYLPHLPRVQSVEPWEEEPWTQALTMVPREHREEAKRMIEEYTDKNYTPEWILVQILKLGE